MQRLGLPRLAYVDFSTEIRENHNLCLSETELLALNYSASIMRDFYICGELRSKNY